MLLQAVFGELFKLCAGAAVVSIGEDADAAARGEEAGHFDVFRVHEADEVLHDDIDTILVEVAVVAEGEEVEFEALALDHTDVGDVGDADFGVVGLSGDGTEGRKFGTVEAHPVVVVGVFVDERLKHFGGVVGGVFCALAAEVLQAFCFAL